MKLGLTADLHLSDVKKHPERINALSDILKSMSESNVSTLIIAGDLFDMDTVDFAVFESLCSSHDDIEIHIIPGNHDSSLNPSDITIPTVHIHNEPEIIELEDIKVLFLPYRQDIEPGKVIAELRDQLAHGRWILVSHCDYGNSNRATNPLEPGIYMPLSRRDIRSPEPLQVFLGHIHKPIQYDKVRYIGSPCPMDISETGRRYFLIYDTATDATEHVEVLNDVLYFNEKFLVTPGEDEAEKLKASVEARIKSWNLEPDEYQRVVIRICAIGYAINRKEIMETLNKCLDSFHFYKDEGPDTSKLKVARDHQLAAITERTRSLIESMNWNFGGNEPEIEEIVTRAMDVIHGEETWK